MNKTVSDEYREDVVDDQEDWIDDEPRISDALLTLGAAVGRGFARPRLTLAVATFAATVVAYYAARNVPEPARVVVRVTETGIGGSGVLGRSDLHNWLVDGALSSQRLLGVIDEYGLYPGERAVSPFAAVEALRDDMDLEVFANWFLVQRSVADQLRSARVAITYTDPDPELAVQVGVALARTMIEFELETRRQIARAELALVEHALDGALAMLARREGRLAAELAASGARRMDDGEGGVVMLGLRRQTRASSALYHELSRRRTALSLLHKAEEAALAQRYDIAAVERPRLPRLSPPQRAAVAASGALAVALPLCALAIGAFDGRIRSRGDVNALGLPMLAHVAGRVREREVRT